MFAVTDATIRAALLPVLAQRHARVLEEMRINAWTSVGSTFGACVDVMGISDVLHGYEIKGDTDTLRRLPKQVAAYSNALPFSTLVVGTKHVDAARGMLPEHWGLIVAHADGDTVRLTEERTAIRNPGVVVKGAIHLLWRLEMIRVLRSAGHRLGKLRYRHDMAEILADASRFDAHRIVAGCIKARGPKEHWRTESCGAKPKKRRASR